jgi:DNA-binding NtrC family response regulator
MLTQTPAIFRSGPETAFPVGAGDLARRAEKHALRVLVVDDEPLVRWAIAETLGTAGYEIDEAADAESAVRALFDRPDPDVVLLDLRLPDCGDLRLLDTVRRLVPAATVILMTAFGTPEVRAEAPGHGAAYVLDKPFDVDALDGLIARLRARQ